MTGRAGRVLRTAAAASALALGACADFDAPSSPVVSLPDVLVAMPDFASDIQPIFTATCATGSCHSRATHQAGLVLQAPDSYASLVNVPSTREPGRLRVAPGNADTSTLVRAIEGTGSVQRMPLGRPPLTPNQIGTIRNWVNQGAQP